MIEVSVHEAKTQLSHLLDLIEDGEEVVIRRHGKPVARLVAAAVAAAESPFGAMAGEFSLPEGWDRPLSPEESEAFWEGKW
jgi:prevent-host-death family protein